MYFMTDAVASSVDFTEYITKITSLVTPAQVLTVLGTVAGVGIGFVLMWFGARKIKSSFVNAFTKGKLSL